MAERLGRRARWTAALLATPGAAALFGAATSWALHATPATSTSSGSGGSVPARQVADPAVLRAQRAATANDRELRRLEKQLAGLRAQLSTLQTAARSASPSGAGGLSAPGAAGTASGASTGPAAGAASLTPAPPPTSAAPPPPTQTSTGASGAPK